MTQLLIYAGITIGVSFFCSLLEAALLGVFLALGAAVTFLFGEALMDWYLGLVSPG